MGIGSWKGVSGGREIKERDSETRCTVSTLELFSLDNLICVSFLSMLQCHVLPRFVYLAVWTAYAFR